MRRISSVLIGLLIVVAALAGCGDQATPTVAPTPEPTATTPPTATPEPTATPTTEPTATPTAEPSPTPEPTATPTATPAPSVSLTEDAYRNADLGVDWQRAGEDWEFIDTSGAEGVFGSLIPLVTQARETPEQYVTLLTIDLPASQVRPLAELMQTDPEEGLAALSLGLGDAAEQAVVTQIGPTNAVLVPLEAGDGVVNYMWIVVQPQGALYVLAEGFEDAEAAAPLLETLAFAREQDLADLTPEEQRARLIAQVEELRGLETKSEVAVEFLDRDELRARLEARAAEEMDPVETEAIGQMLKLLGLLPADVDLLQTMFDLQEEQILGFYDPAEDAFYLVDTASDEPLDALDQATFVHEYVHALQDQYYDLSRLSDDESLSEDQRGALQSLGEGDATLLMAQWAASNLSAAELQQIVAQASELDPEVLDRTPPYVQSAMLIPYELGAQFVQTVVEAGGWEALDAIWRDLPASTEQLLHPEKYGEDDPTAVMLPAGLAAALGDGWSEPLRDVWGEADLLLLWQELLGEDAAAAAAGWDGSQYVFLSNDNGAGLFAIEIVWDSEDEAAEGQQAMAAWLEASGFAGQDAVLSAPDGRGAFLQGVNDRISLVVGSQTADVEALVGELGW